MLPLSGFDASFLYAETPRTHMHTLKALVFDLPEERGEALRRSVIDNLEAQVDRLPALRLVPVDLPISVGHPVWRTAEVDLRDHVGFEVIDAAPRARERVIGAFLSRPLRRDRPLWEALAIEDRGRGELVIAMKIHHALADGRAAERMLEIAAGAAEAEPPDEPVASGLESVRRAAPIRLVGALRAASKLDRLLVATTRGLYRRISKQTELHANVILPFTSPHTHFAQPVTERREIAFARLSFEDARTIKQRAGATVNDVVLAVTAGALRRYLCRFDECVDRPLVASMPVGVTHAPYSYGNHLSNVFVPIHVDVADPLERLRQSARSARDVKALHATLGEDLLMDWSELTASFAMKGLWKTVRLSRRAPAALIVSNVPGPPQHLELEGADLRELYSVGPLLETTGLNLTYWSYDGVLSACVLMCPDHGGDPEQLAADLEAELAALLEASREPSPRPPARAS